MTNQNPLDPSLALTPSIPFAYGTRPQNQWRLLPGDKNHPNWQDHELVIADLGGGLNKVWGRIFPHYLGVDNGDSNRTSSASGIDVSYPGQAILTTKMTAESVWSGADRYYTVNAYGTMFVGSGSTANISLWKENASAPGLAAVTFTPDARITSLSYLSFNSAAPMLVTGFQGTAAKTLHSDLTTQDTLSSTDTLWGAITSPLNAQNPNVPCNILYQGTTLGTISSDQAATSAAVDTGTRFNAGGYAVGIANVAVTPGNLVLRAVWVIPNTPSTAGMFAGAPQLPTLGAQIWHTNLYGQDPQPLVTTLDSVSWCIIFEGVLYYTDGQRVMMNDGKETDLGWVYEREPDSDYRYLCTGLGIANGQLVVQAVRLNMTTVASSKIQFEKYDSVAKTWYPASSVVSPNLTVTVSDTGPGVVSRQVTSYPMGPLPYSVKSQCMYLLPVSSAGNEKDYYQFIPPSGYSHFWNARFTSGSTHAGQATEASGTWDSAALEMPWPLKGLPTVITGIGIYGDILAGGTGGSTTLASAMVEQATQGITGTMSYAGSKGKVYHKVGAKDGLRWDARWTDFGPERYDPFNRLKIRLTLTQDDSRTDWTPNALPIVIRMRSFTDGVVG